MRGVLLALLLTVALGCEGDDPVPTDAALPDADRRDASADAGPADAGPLLDAGPACTRAPTDYAPGADDDWPACISDDGQYHRVEPTISTVARVMAFETIAGLLFDPGRDPSPAEFLMARVLYQESEGLDSRIVRRFDPHFVVPDGTSCGDPGAPEMVPDYCVGPARLQPLILGALNAGIDGTEPRAQAARIEAALLWFLYVSAYKEGLTCTTVPRDCDSSYAYYTGGEAAREGIGLARYVRGVDPLAHDRAWDGILALRCWRDLDPAATATDLATRELARDQYDRAVLDGVAAVLRQRLVLLGAATGGEAVYQHAFVTTLGPVLDRHMRSTAPAEATALATALSASDPASVDVEAAVAAIDAVFRCP